MLEQAQDWAGGGDEPWVEAAKGVDEKGCVDVEEGGGDPVLCLIRYLITYCMHVTRRKFNHMIANGQPPHEKVHCHKLAFSSQPSLATLGLQDHLSESASSDTY